MNFEAMNFEDDMLAISDLIKEQNNAVVRLVCVGFAIGIEYNPDLVHKPNENRDVYSLMLMHEFYSSSNVLLASLPVSHQNLIRKKLSDIYNIILANKDTGEYSRMYQQALTSQDPLKRALVAKNELFLDILAQDDDPFVSGTAIDIQNKIEARNHAITMGNFCGDF